MRFLKDFLQGYKLLIKQKDINRINVPHYPELKIKNILQEVVQDPNVMRHLNYYQDSKQLPERDFFFDIVGTLAPQYLENLVKNQNRLRNQTEQDVSQLQSIAIRDEIYKEIQDEPFFSKCRGKASSLLKVQSKTQRQATKKRKTYDLQQKFQDVQNIRMSEADDIEEEKAQSSGNKRIKFNI